MNEQVIPMTIEIIIPKMGETTTEVRILHWMKSEGEAVEKGEPLLEVETDKATLEIESFATGVLKRILVSEGEYADAMQVVALLEGEGGEETRPRAETPRTAARPSATPVARRLAEDMGVDLTQISGTGHNGQITTEDVRKVHPMESEISEVDKPAPASTPASPKAKRLAKEMGIDLRLIRGTGMDGMITVDDVQSAVRDVESEFAGERAGELSRLRQTIAFRMSKSKQTIPHFYLMADVSMEEVERLREDCVHDHDWERPPTYTDVIVRACALALASIPEVNVRYNEAKLIARETVDIGVAVGVEQGLLVPVLPNADQLGLLEVSQEIRSMTKRARAGKLKESDLAEKSMVVSNLGMEGVDAFIAIIDPPDPFILAVGRVVDRVVPIEGEVRIMTMCTLTLSIDHRVLDGVMGARFLMRVKEHLEQPAEIMGV